MEFGERKRRRKSQSFKLVKDEELDPAYMENSSCKDAKGETKDPAVSDVWLEDDGMEIKKQITGMMRLLSDKASRTYQRVGAEHGSSKKEPQDNYLNWIHQPQSLTLEDHQSKSWSSTGDPGPSPTSITMPSGPGCSQYTRSKALRILNNTNDMINLNEANDTIPPAATEDSCCMCNCKGTLQAILQELRAMRRLMQNQKAPLGRQEQAVSSCQPRLAPSPAPRRRPCKRRRQIYKVAAQTRTSAVANMETASLVAAPMDSGKREERKKDQGSPANNRQLVSSDVYMASPQNKPITDNSAQNPLFNQMMDTQCIESEVRLANDYDVFITKAQLDSILVNYTRSGSLLFRKLVCAFFDDATLANSLPNGKRKRGINDNRKGLDQNIVGAIKVFTERYCTEHRIEKLPGPRDWVQILQDQIKLARRRLKRDAAEEVLNGPSTSCDYNKPTIVECAVVKL
ncbi:BEN domain-containing protein 7 [Genypterus blacodes]|uniref:BEN domain-containing protein 7 n=1 Tax=Genypterus blacodes TaxID=154954 RepID=UPI003F76674A